MVSASGKLTLRALISLGQRLTGFRAAERAESRVALKEADDWPLQNTFI